MDWTRYPTTIKDDLIQPEPMTVGVFEELTSALIPDPEGMGMNRVSFRIDEENLKSRRAVERIGATYGGKLRAERILPDGRIRDYGFYSIIATEWPQVKARLMQLSSSTRL